MLAYEKDHEIRLGRWFTPDPLGGDITNPQSLNRYAYALNNPTTNTDPLGLDPSNCTSGADENGDPVVTCSGPDQVTVSGSLDDWTDDVSPVATPMGWQLTNVGPYQQPPSGGFGGGGGSSSSGSASGPPPASTPQRNINPCAPSGNAPPPSYFEAKGFTAYTLETLPGVPASPGSGALTNVTGLALNGYNLFSFHRSGALDAQAYGASPAYANYVFGVYMGAEGYSLPFTLSAANLYGEFFSTYRPTPANPMGQVYTHIPEANAANITAGFSAEQNGALCSAE